MPEPSFYRPLSALSKLTRNAAPAHAVGGNFIQPTTTTKFYAVTAILWLGLFATCVVSWIGFWTIGLVISRLLGIH